MNHTFIGSLKQYNNHYILEDIMKIKIEAVAKYKGIYVLKYEKDTCTSVPSSHLMPFVITSIPDENRIKIVPSRILYFLRQVK